MSGDIGKNGTTLVNKKVSETGFTEVDFQHEAITEETRFNLKALREPTGIVNPLPSIFDGVVLTSANFQLFDEDGNILVPNQHYVLSGMEVTLINGVTISEGGIIYGKIANVRQKPMLNLAEGFQISPKNTLEAGQTLFNLGDSFKIPTGLQPEPIIVMRNRYQLYHGEDYTFYDPNGTGHSQLLLLNRPGELIEGEKEVMQVFNNGVQVNPNPLNQRREIETIRGVQERLIQAWETNFGIDPTLFRLGGAAFDNNKTSLDTLIGLLSIPTTVIETQYSGWIDFDVTPSGGSIILPAPTFTRGNTSGLYTQGISLYNVNSSAWTFNFADIYWQMDIQGGGSAAGHFNSITQRLKGNAGRFHTQAGSRVAGSGDPMVVTAQSVSNEGDFLLTGVNGAYTAGLNKQASLTAKRYVQKTALQILQENGVLP